MKNVLISLVCFALLAGCASFSIAPLPPDQPEQAWQAKGILFDRGTVERTKHFSATVVKAPDQWVRSERSGTLSVGSNRRIAVARNAWRAIAFLPDGGEMETSALLGPENYLVVLLPGVSESDAKKAKIAVLSGLSAFALDMSGREYGGETGFSMKGFLDGIRNGSVSVPLPSVVENLDPGTERGDLFFKKLLAMFPTEKVIDGERYRIAATAPEGLERATHEYLSPDDRVISNAELFVTPGMEWFALGEAVLGSVYQIGTARPQGPYRLSPEVSVQNQYPERERRGDQ